MNKPLLSGLLAGCLSLSVFSCIQGTSLPNDVTNNTKSSIDFTNLKVGDKFIGELAAEDKEGNSTVLMTKTYKVIDLNSLDQAAGGLTTNASDSYIATIVEKTEINDDSLKPDKNELITNDLMEEKLKQFLINHWDAYIGGVDDKGINIKEFFDYMNKFKTYDFSMDVFMELFNESGMASLSDFIKFVETIHNKSLSLKEFFQFLGQWNLKLKDFLEILKENNTDINKIVEYLEKYKLNFNDLSTPKLEEFLSTIDKENFKKHFKHILDNYVTKDVALTTIDPALTTQGVVGPAVGIASLFVKLVKDDTVKASYTNYILKAADKDPANYINARSDYSGKVTFTLKDIIFQYVAEQWVVWVEDSKCDARYKDGKGRWIPSLLVKAKNKVNDPTISSSINYTLQSPWSYNNNPADPILITNLNIDFHAAGFFGLSTADLSGYISVKTGYECFHANRRW